MGLLRVLEYTEIATALAWIRYGDVRRAEKCGLIEYIASQREMERDMKAGYTKIDGHWFLKITGTPAERQALRDGAVIVATKRDGSTKTETISHPVDVQRDYVIVAFRQQRQSTSRSVIQSRRDRAQARRNGDFYSSGAYDESGL